MSMATPSSTAHDLVRSLQRTWPAWLGPVLPDGAVAPDPAHLLAGEVGALASGRPASLPFLLEAADLYAWITLAPDADQMREAHRDLRAWLLPSFAWADPRNEVVPPSAATGASSPMLLALSPAGYLRWRSRADEGSVRRVLDRLRRARELADARPVRGREPEPSLDELRQQFATALAAGNRDAAAAAVDQIEGARLDTSANVVFMRLRLWDQFDEAARIVGLPELDGLARQRMPSRAQRAALRAFHAHFLAPLEDASDTAGALRAYGEFVAPVVGPLVPLVGLGESAGFRRLRGYRAALLGDAVEGARVLAAADDEFLRRVLTPLLTPPPQSAPTLTLEERFFEARKQQNWVAVQELGESLLAESVEPVPILRRSLEFRPNPALWARLEQLAIPATTGPAAASATPGPQDWGQWFAQLPDSDVDALDAFLEEHDRLDLDALRPAQLRALLDPLTDLLTDLADTLSSERRRVFLTGLAGLADECLNEPHFPRPTFVDLYRLLALAWADSKTGSAYPPDGQVMLELVGGVLRISPAGETPLVEALEAWWKARPAKGLLPFLFGAIELLDRLGGEGHAERFWVMASETMMRWADQLTPRERLVWRQVGRRIGYDDALLDEYVPLPPTADGAAADPLRVAGLRKIAIVSTREEQAMTAADMVRERCAAEVIVVTATHGGHGTSEAVTADVIAYVWSASTHAVFRAFDKVDRRKIAYVQGTGSASIVLALERWVAERPATATLK